MCAQNVLRTQFQNVQKNDNIKLHGRGWYLEHQSSHPTERCNNSLSMKLNLRLRGAQNVKPKRNKRERHVVENTFSRTQGTAPKRDSKRERLNLVLERKTPKRERKTPKRRFKATKIYIYIYIYNRLLKDMRRDLWVRPWVRGMNKVMSKTHSVWVMLWVRGMSKALLPQFPPHPRRFTLLFWFRENDVPGFFRHVFGRFCHI